MSKQIWFLCMNKFSSHFHHSFCSLLLVPLLTIFFTEMPEYECKLWIWSEHWNGWWSFQFLDLSFRQPLCVKTLLTHSPGTKWPPFHRRFQMHFHEWKVLYFESTHTEFGSKGSNKQYSNNGSDNGLGLIRQQAIIWANADPFLWRIYMALGGMS